MVLDFYPAISLQNPVLVLYAADRMRHDADSTHDKTMRLTVSEAAGVMGISAEAVRQRIKRGTLTTERDASGNVFVILAADSTHANSDRMRPNGDSTYDSTELVEELRDRVRSLETQLSEERTANRENRRLLAAALERIPAIEAPEEPPPESPTTPADGEAPNAPPEHGKTPGRKESVPSGSGG